MAQARVRVVEELSARNVTPDAAFDSWDKNSDGLLTEVEFVEGVVGLRAGLQRDEARQIFALAKGDAEQMTKTKLQQFLGKGSAGGDSAPPPGSGEAQVLEGELRRLRTLNAQLLKEKDELFQSLRDAERVRKGRAAGGELAQAERLQEIEQSNAAQARILKSALYFVAYCCKCTRALTLRMSANAAQLRKLQDDLAVAEYNQQDLMQLISSYQDTRVRKPGALSVPRGGPRTSNVVVVEIVSVRLDAGREGLVDEPTTFFSVDFFAHDTQVTPPCTGFDVNIGWSCEFEVEEDDLFLSYLETDTLNLELMQRVNEETPFKRLACCRVALKALLDRASLVDQAANLLTPDGSKMGQALVSMRMQHSIFASVERYRKSQRKKVESTSTAANTGMLEALGVPLDKIQLSITIDRCEGLRAARYGALPWPYCQYEMPVTWPGQEESHVTETRSKEANPVFNDRKIWNIPTPELALAFRTQELQVFVFDDDDQDDVQKYLGFAKVRLAPLFLAPPQPLKATLDLEDPRGVKNGSISLTVEWYTPALVAAEAQRKILAAQRALAAPARDGEKAFAAPETGEARKSYRQRKVSTAKVDGTEDELLEMLRNHLSEVGHSPDMVFETFSKGHGEISFDDFKTNMDNEPLGFSADQLRKLFEYIARSKDKDITKARWREAIAPGTFGILPADKEHLVLLYRTLSFVSTSPMWEEILKEKGNLRFTIVTDWFSQPADQTLPTSGAKGLRILARMATAEFAHKEIFRMDQRANRARVEAVLQNNNPSDSDKIEIMLCKVKPDGTVLLDDHVASVSLDIKTIFRDKADASELSLNLINYEGKGVAKLTLDTGMLDSLKKLSTGGVGAVAANVTGVDWEADATAKLAALLASKGFSPAASFQHFDEKSCDNKLDWEEFKEAIRNEPLQLDEGQLRRLFDYLCGGKDGIDLATWKAKMSGSAVAASGVVSAQEAKQSIVLMVKTAQVNDAELKTQEIQYLCVRADFTRQASAKLASTEVRAIKGGNIVELNDLLTMSLKGDGSDAQATANRKRLMDGFASKDGDARIDVVLVGLVDKGEGSRREIELGVAALDLKKLYRDGDDLTDFALMPTNNGRAVGRVMVSLYFMQALKELNVDGKSKPSGASGSSGGGGQGLLAPFGGGSVAGGGGGGLVGVSGGGQSKSGAGAGATVSSEAGQKISAAAGHVVLTLCDLRLEGTHSLASDDKVKDLFMSANFFGLFSEREEAKARSGPIPLDDLRTDKNKTRPVNHVVKLPVDDSLYSANRDALNKIFTADESASAGQVSLVLYRALAASEYSADGDAKELARGILSVNDMLHASLLDDEQREVALKDSAGVVAHCKVLMSFTKINLPSIIGHTPFKQAEMDKNIIVHFRTVQTMKASKLRNVTHIAVGIKLQGAKDIVPGSRSRALQTKDLSGRELERGDYCVNHKVLLALEKEAALRQSLLDKKDTTIKLMLLNALDDTELAECDVDLRKDVVDKGQDLAKTDVVFLDFDGNTKVAKAVVDVAVLHALLPLQAPPSAAADAPGAAPSNVLTEMSLLVEKLEVDQAHLGDDAVKKLFLQVKWFGSKKEDSIALAPAASLPLRHEFKLDITQEHNGTAIQDLISERLAKEATRGGGGDVQMLLMAKLDGASADRVLASATIDVGAIMFDGAKLGDGQRNVFLVNGPDADVASTAAATSGTKVTVTLKFRQALAQVAVRMQGRQGAVNRNPDTEFVLLRKEGSQLATQAEKESNMVVSIKGVQLTAAALGNTTGVYNGPLFLALDYFGHETDDVAIGGTEAYLRQQQLPISERFLCAVDSGHAHNRKLLKEALDKKELNMTIKLFHEPWLPGAKPWAFGKLASSDFLTREGTDMQVCACACARACVRF